MGRFVFYDIGGSQIQHQRLSKSSQEVGKMTVQNVIEIAVAVV